MKEVRHSIVQQGSPTCGIEAFSYSASGHVVAEERRWANVTARALETSCLRGAVSEAEAELQSMREERCRGPAR
jgi:uncharacterized protein YbbK (DUF523 family)